MHKYTQKYKPKYHEHIWKVVVNLFIFALMLWASLWVFNALQSFITPKSEPIEQPKIHKPPLPKLNKEPLTVYVTQYSRADSCHNVVNGKCLMASGKEVYEGAVACPRDIPLGTKILLDDTEYTCEDRYAKWLDDKREYPTIDVFVEENPRGKEIKQATLLSN